VAREELGTKRVCPESGRKFYDLNKDPIVSPYSGMSYPLSFFEGEKDKVAKPEDEEAVNADPKAADADTDDDGDDGAELVSLEEADAEAAGEDIPDLEDDDDDIGAAADDTFLEEEEEDGDDIGINVDVEEDED